MGPSELSCEGHTVSYSNGVTVSFHIFRKEIFKLATFNMVESLFYMFLVKGNHVMEDRYNAWLKTSIQQILRSAEAVGK